MARGSQSRKSTAVTRATKSPRGSTTRTSVLGKRSKASVAVRATKSPRTKRSRRASAHARYTEPEEEDEDSSADSSEEQVSDSSSEEADSSDEENAGDPSQIYDTIERFSKGKATQRPQTASQRRTSTTAVRSQALLQFIQNGEEEAGVDSWVARYQRAARTATTELVNLVIQCSGSQRVISEEEFETVDLDQVMEEFHTERYLTSGGDYPLKGTSKESSRCQKSYTQFWVHLLRICRAEIIYDSYLMPSLNAWLVAFSRSKLRPFRHVATLTSCQIVLSLSEIANSIREELQAPERLANARKSKGSGATAARLQKQLDQMHQQIMDVEYLINGHFSGVFKRRYRDRVPLVRKTSIEYLYRWMKSYPSVFVSDHYLKYIGWALSDRDADCRRNAVECLSKLCEETAFLPMMEDFITFYRARILRMPCDVDAPVASSAIRLLGRLAADDRLEEDSIKEMYKLVSDSNATIRHEAAKFVKIYQLDDFEEGERLADESDNQTYCRKFLEFILEETSQSEVPEYIVDALWDPTIWSEQAPKRRNQENPLGYIFLRDWDAMIQLLMPESGRESDLTSPEQAVLCRVMLAAVRKSMGEEIVPKQRGEHNIRETPARQKRNQSVITRSFIRTLGPLLSKFQADEEKVASLLPIAYYFDLALLEEEQAKDDFVQLCQTIKELLLTRVEEKVSANCAKVFRHFLIETNPFREEAQEVFLHLEDELYDKVDECVTMIEDLEENVHRNGCMTIRNTLSRMTQLIAIVQLQQFPPDMVDQLSKILYARLQDADLADQIRISALEVLSYYVMWKMTTLTKSLREGNPVDLVLLGEVRRDEHLLFSSLEKFLVYQKDTSSRQLLNYCYPKLLDLMTLFSPRLKTTALQELAYDAAGHLRTEIKNYFDEEMAQPVDHSDIGEVELILAHKRTVLTSTARAVMCSTLPQIEFGPLLLLNLLRHNDKKMDDILKLFMAHLRKQNSPAVESRIVYRAVVERYEEAVERATPAAMQAYKDFATKLGSVFPHRKLECQDTLHGVLQGAFLEAVREFPARQSLLEGLVMFASKLFPNRATRLVNFCENVVEEQEINMAAVQPGEPLSNFFEYLRGVGDKTDPAELRKRIANQRTSLAPKEDAPAPEEEEVDPQVLKDVAKQLDLPMEEEEENEESSEGSIVVGESGSEEEELITRSDDEGATSTDAQKQFGDQGQRETPEASGDVIVDSQEELLLELSPVPSDDEESEEAPAPRKASVAVKRPRGNSLTGEQESSRKKKKQKVA